MKITYDDFSELVTSSVTEFTQRQLTDSSDGQLERLYNEQRSLIAALGRLLELLADKGQLTAPEVSVIVGGFNRQAKFEE